MKAAVVSDFTQPLRIENVPTPEPSDGQVLVRIEACGLCHTDIHAAHGDWPIKPHLPLIPGHEGVGIVAALRPGAGEEISEGDRVAITWPGFACGHCRYCNSGRETLCEAQLNTGYSVDGGYAEYAAAYARHVVKVPDGVDSLDAAPLSCAGVTVYKAGQELRRRPLAAVRDLRCRRPGSPGGAVRQDPGRDRGRRRPGGRQAGDGEGTRRRLRGQRRRAGSCGRDPEAGRRRRRYRPGRGSQAVRAGLRLAGPRRDADDGRPAAGQLREAADLRDGAQGDQHQGLDRRDPPGRGGRVQAAHARSHPVLRETRPLEEVNQAFDDVEHARNKAPRVVLTV